MSPLAWVGLGLIVFAAALVYDWANAHYVAAAASGHPARACGWSGVTAAFGLVGLLGIVEVSRWLVLPEIAGFVAGTYLAVARRRPA